MNLDSQAPSLNSVSMNAPLGIERQLHLTRYVVLRRGLESGDQPALVLHECVKLQVAMYFPEQVRAGITLCSAAGQE